MITPKNIRYFDLFPLLDDLESERPGIRKRVYEFLCDERYMQFSIINGRILGINLFFYGIGDEYPTDYLNKYPNELNHCKKIHPEAFIKGTKEYKLRMDFNLIISIYNIKDEEIETFYIMPNF